jgi:hypothetical protein
MLTITFKKQRLGQWRRNENESKLLVNEEAMHQEIAKLVKDGWRVIMHGVTHTRMIEVRK